MVATAPLLVTWIYVKDDQRIGRELARLAGLLAKQGLVRNRELDAARTSEALLTQPHVVEGGLAVFLASTAAIQDSQWQYALRDALREHGPRIALVLVRAVNLQELPTDARNIVLPKDGVALAGRRDSDDAMFDVIEAIRELATMAPPLPSSAGDDDRPEGEEVTARGGELLAINEIFRVNGPPSVTFVEPPHFRELQLELSTMGAGLILEGPSKTGKTTAVRKAMETLAQFRGRLGTHSEVGAEQQTWWNGQRPPPLDEVQRFLRGLVDGADDHWLFIDDFHYLESPDYRRELSFTVKALADQPRSHAKITLIGINPLGEALLQTTPDLAGRFRIMHLHQAPEAERNSLIAELISLGERAAGVRFLRRGELVIAARGSFFVAQFLCNRAARQAGVLETQRRVVDIPYGPADVVAAIQGELAGNYRAPLLRLAAFDQVAPPRGAGLSLLWLLSRSAGGFVSIREAELRFPTLKPVFDWYLESNLSRCFEENPTLRGLLYFNRATGTLTMEDPQLDFYLRNLDWPKLALASGHGHVVFHPDDGPLWPTGAGGGGSSGGGPGGGEVELLEPTLPLVTASPVKLQRVLHLSDLHFDAPDQATIAYAQLAADLRQQGVEQLDAVVISGDLVNRATAPEYKVAEEFLEKLKSGFGVSAQSMVLVPGNHDVSWANSEAAYSLTKRAQLATPPAPGTFIEHTPEIIEVRDDAKYRLRFAPFSELYEKVRGEPYPLAYEKQATIYSPPGGGLTILGLNSAWEIDHKFRDRASIHMVALASALEALPRPQPGELRIAAFHHPLQSDEESRIRDNSFLQQLAVAGFRVVLHGHVHRADNTLYRYDRSIGGRQLEIVTAGTFGAPVREWVPGYPLQYNLLLISPIEVIVETRCRTEVNGAWRPDARWLQGPGQNPLPRYAFPR